MSVTPAFSIAKLMLRFLFATEKVDGLVSGNSLSAQSYDLYLLCQCQVREIISISILRSFLCIVLSSSFFLN